MSEMRRTSGLIYFEAVLIINVSLYNTNYIESSFFALSFDRKNCEKERNEISEFEECFLKS